MNRTFVLAATLAAGIAMAPMAGEAAILSLENVNTTTIGLNVNPTPVASLTSAFDFNPPVVGGDGQVVSKVFTGSGIKAGSYLYAYQFSLFSTSSAEEFSSAKFEFLGVPHQLDYGNGLKDGVVITSGTLDGFAAGTKSPTGASFSNELLNISYFGNSLNRGETSYVVAFWSNAPFAEVEANVLDGTNTVLDPKVLAPVPVPAALPLMLTALAGLGLIGRRKMKAAA